MHGSVDAFLAFVQMHKELGYLAMFLISVMESIAFIGELVPGTTLLVIVGAMAAKGELDPEALIVASSLGAIVGDVFSFWLGRRGEGALGRFGRFVKPEYLEKGRAFVQKHGSKSVLMGRFIGPLRPIVPFVTGLFRMDVRKFVVWDFISALSWSMVYIYLGNALYIVWGFAKLWSTRGGMIFILLMTTMVVAYLLREYIVHQSMVFLMHTGNLWDRLTNYLQGGSSYPVRFLGRRIDRNRFSGLKLTISVTVFVLCFIMLASIVAEVAGTNVIPDSDMRIANYLYVFRTPGMMKFFSWVGVFGNTWAVMTLGVVLMVMMWLLKEPGYIFPMWVGLAGSYICNLAGGFLFKRPVPVIAAATERFEYFSSSYSSVPLMFYGFIIYFVIKISRNIRVKLNAIFILVPFVILIGASRIYLGMYYLTDVQAGWTLGMLWLVLSIVIAEYLEYTHPHGHIHAIPPKIKALCGALAACWIVLFLFFGLSEYSKLPPENVAPSPIKLEYPGDIFLKKHFPRYLESLSGERREPVNIIIAAADPTVLGNDMEKAGWLPADETSFQNVLKRAKAIITGDNYYNAPVTPAFWCSRIQDISFERPGLKKGIAEMHWVRLWRTGATTYDGREIFVGSASYDISLGSKLMHKIRPDIDSERDMLSSSLYNSGSIYSYGRIRLVEKTSKKKLFTKTYFTDGMADVIVLK